VVGCVRTGPVDLPVDTANARPPCNGGRLGATVTNMSADSIRTAYDALMTGDVEPLVSLVHPDMTWRGRRRLMRLWKRPPS
jgi:hypothetical protein